MAVHSATANLCLLLAAVIFAFNLGLVTAHLDVDYARSSDCEEKSCEYDYELTGSFNDKRAKEEGTIAMTFTLQCESDGVYRQKFTSKKYCISVKQANIKMFEVQKTAASEGQNKIEKGETNIAEMMNKHHFCFIRDINGQVLKVLHHRDETVGVVNLKKTIASAFQANFLKTETKMESDSSSMHKSHYIYSENKDTTTEHRYVHSEDVVKYAANNKKQNGISVESEEDIELDKNNVIQKSNGKSSSTVTKEADSEENEDAGAHEDIPPIATESTYTLKLRSCSSSVEAFEYIYVSEQDQVTDTLLARFNEREHHQFEMQDLYSNLPDLQKVAHVSKRSTDEKEKIKITNSLLGSWRRLLHLESKHGALGQRKRKVFYIRKLLEDSLQKDDESEDLKHLRLILYSLLNAEGSLDSQKALLDALVSVKSEEEHSNVLFSLALLESPHPSTVTSFKEYISSNKANDQLLLTFATLGRHSHAEQEVVETILSHMVESSTTVNGSDILYYIHALGNTGSSLMIPYIEPFLSSENEVVKQGAIDAFRTISNNNLAQRLFTEIIDTDPSLNTLLAIVDSLNFPYRSFVYYPDLVEPKENEVESQLIKKLVNATINADDADLNKQTKKFLKNIGSKTALELMNNLSTTYNKKGIMHLLKRSQTTKWDSNADNLYELVASSDDRAKDIYHYPYNKAYLWGRTFGPEKLHLRLGAGGFGGAGATGFKVFAKGVIQLYVYGRTFDVVTAEYMNRFHIIAGPYTKKFIKAFGITFLNNETGVALPYNKDWSKNLYSQRLFRLEYKIWVWIGFLNFFIESHVNLDASLNIDFYTQKVEAEANFGPTLSVTGGAELELLLIWKVGLQVTASIGYFVTPKASVTLCDNAPRGDLTGCFGLFHGSKGIDVNLNAYYKRRSCGFSGWSFSCTWGPKSTLSLFSSTYTSAALSQRLLWGKCTACDCRGPIHKYCAKALGIKPVASGCYCRLENYA